MGRLRNGLERNFTKDYEVSLLQKQKHCFCSLCSMSYTYLNTMLTFTSSYLFTYFYMLNFLADGKKSDILIEEFSHKQSHCQKPLPYLSDFTSALREVSSSQSSTPGSIYSLPRSPNLPLPIEVTSLSLTFFIHF